MISELCHIDDGCQAEFDMNIILFQSEIIILLLLLILNFDKFISSILSKIKVNFNDFTMDTADEDYIE